MEPRQIFNLIRDEQAQTIAFVISYLKQEKSAEVLTMLTPALRDEVMARVEALDAAITAALSAVTVDQVRGWFRHCGYCA